MQAAEIPESFRWDDIRVLLAVVRSGSLKAAGAVLSINPSTVSRRIEALEEALQQELFERRPDGLFPTIAVEQLMPHAEQLEAAAGGIKRAIEGLESTPEGLVKITAPPGVIDNFVAPALPRLREQYPEIVVELDSRVAYVDLSRREADIALRAIRPESGDLIAVKLVATEETIVANPKIAKQLSPLRSLDDAPWVTWGPDLSHIPPAQWVSAHVAKSSIVFRTSSINAQIAAVEKGLGVMLQGRPFIGIRGLTEVALDPELLAKLPPTPKESLWMVGHRALRQVPRVAAVWEFLMEQFQGYEKQNRRATGF